MPDGQELPVPGDVGGEELPIRGRRPVPLQGDAMLQQAMWGPPNPDALQQAMGAKPQPPPPPPPQPGVQTLRRAMGTAAPLPQPSGIPKPPANPQPPVVAQRQATPSEAQNPRASQGFGNAMRGFATGFATHGQAEPVGMGPGSTNARYAPRQAPPQSGSLIEESQKAYQDALKSADESRFGRIGEARLREGTRARLEAAQAAQQRADLAQQLAEFRGRGIAYDQKSGQFVQNGEVYIPKNVEEGASLEAAHGIKGKYSEMGNPLWGQERRNRQEIDDILAGRKAGLAPKNFTQYREAAARTRNSRLQALESDFRRGFAEAEDQYGLVAAHNQNKADVEREYQTQLRVIADGEAKAQHGRQTPRTSAPPREYRYMTKPNAQGIQLGSDDGEKWFHVATGEAWE